MSVVEEIREQQKKSLSTMSFKEKLAYFWDYYKVHALAAVILIIVTVSIIHQFVTNKDYAFYATVLNAGTIEYEDTTATKWAVFLDLFRAHDILEIEVALELCVLLEGFCLGDLCVDGTGLQINRN